VNRRGTRRRTAKTVSISWRTDERRRTHHPGFGAVEMDLADGARVYIGSDEPERLQQAILATRGAR